MTAAIAVLACLAVLASLLGRLHVLLHVLQQEHYENARLIGWVASSRSRLGVPIALCLLAAGAVVSGMQAIADAAAVALAAAALVAGAAVSVRTWRRPQIKPLVFTPRARRLLGVAVALNALPLALVGVVVPREVVALVAAALGGLEYVGAPWVLALANRLLATHPIKRAFS